MSERPRCPCCRTPAPPGAAACGRCGFTPAGAGPVPDDAPTALDAAKLILRLSRRRGGAAAAKPPTPEVMRLVRELGGGDVLWDAGDRRWRWRDARDVGRRR
jgi:hypothetical protein